MKSSTEILHNTLKELADRLAGIDLERNELVRQIDGLKKLIRLPSKRKGGRRKFTVAQKRAQSKRMKDAWAKRKKNKAN